MDVPQVIHLHDEDDGSLTFIGVTFSIQRLMSRSDIGGEL